ncbi:hypothetical protein U0070_025462 [Myodes glareolus]|uniref:Uncharacterized protein n=1 Tax=Myodes glareolus TaxID=447135 RepID=A0AAW0HL47_MYOGA
MHYIQHPYPTIQSLGSIRALVSAPIPPPSENQAAQTRGTKVGSPEHLGLPPQMNAKGHALKAGNQSHGCLSSPARSFPAEPSSGLQAQDSPDPTTLLQKGSRVAPR